MALVIGDKLGTYEIKASIGAGGMGEVYRALDTKLNREVALKVLPEDMASNPERLARFHGEARAAAALNHPNIVTLYSVEQASGVHFLTMELVDGQTLMNQIPPQGMPVERVLEMGAAMADALAAANDKGLVHRDLKPANIMITTDGRVKVLDFGLAKIMQTAVPENEAVTMFDRTQPGMVMGTPPYMSPEQISGGAVDHRTDIFSLGTIFYEMLTGLRPFQGKTQMDIAASILRDPMPRVARADVPAGLLQLIEKCLAKDAAARMVSAKALAAELRAVNFSSVQPARVAVVTPAAASVRTDAGDDAFWVAVAPFKFAVASPELSALAEGLTEEVIAGLSRFSYLRVVTSGTMGARYVLEGSLRQAGSQLRVAVQLKDTTSGANLWAENYTRAFAPDRIFEIQDDLVPTIVSTVGETNGVLTHNMWTSLRDRDPATLTPYQAMLRCFGATENQSPEELTFAAAALERANQQELNHSGCLAMLSVVYSHSFGMGFYLAPEPMDASLTCARRAVTAEPSNHLAHHALAMAHFFRKDIPSFQSAVERAVALNPMDSYTLASLGMRTAYLVNWAKGCEMVDRAMKMNPRHPGWYWFPLTVNAFRQRDFAGALNCAVRINLPTMLHSVACLAAIHGQLGNEKEATQAVKELLALVPTFASDCRERFARYFSEPELLDLWMESWGKAGLFGAQPAVNSGSGESPAAEGFWVAVLPFRASSAEVAPLADGMFEEILAGLSRFSYLRVIGRGSTLRYAGQPTDLRTVGSELGARYILEGSVRQAGGKLRFTIQMVDASTGAQMWAETYERLFDAAAAFEVQDDLVPRVISTVADLDGILPQSTAEVLRAKREADLTPHEALLRSLRYFKTFTPEEQALAKRVLERAVEAAPSRGDCHALLSHLYSTDYWSRYDPRPDALERALAAARRAVDVAPSNNLSYWALSLVLFLRRDISAFRIAANRAIELNPMDGSVVTFMGHLIAYSGDWERGLAIARPASALNPNHSGWHELPEFLDAYRRRDYQRALEAALHLNMGGLFQEAASRAAAYGQLGRAEEARKATGELLASMPDFAEEGPAFYRRFQSEELVEHLMDGWRKAGLNFDGSRGEAAAARK